MQIDKYMIPYKELEFNFEHFFSPEKDKTIENAFKRPAEALDLGLNLHTRGYNIFVTGETGTGRTTFVTQKIKEIQKKHKPGPDLCYVFNFELPDTPILISFKPGQGKKFKSDVDNFSSRLISQMKKLFEHKIFKNSREQLMDQYQQKQNKLMKDFQIKLDKHQFTLVQIDDDTTKTQEMDIFPIINGKATGFTEIEELVVKGEMTEKEYDRIHQQYFKFSSDLNEVMLKIDDNERELDEKIHELYVDTVDPFIESKITNYKKKYKNKKVTHYLNSMKKFVLFNLDILITAPENDLEREELEKLRIDFFKCLTVNLLVDNSKSKHAPLEVLNMPTYKNLFGNIESKETTSLFVDVRTIKSGALLQANGGFLILYAADFFNDVTLWNHLVRVLKSGKLQIQNQDNFYSNQNSSLKPEQIDIDLKIIIIGSNYHYDFLYNMDYDFRYIFKVKAEFDTEIHYNKQVIDEYLVHLKEMSKKNQLLKITDCGFNEIIKYSIKLAGNKKKISTKFSEINDLLKESDFWAKKNNKKEIDAEIIKTALKNKKRRVDLYEQQVLEMFQEGTLLVDFDAKKIGTLNGLTVYDYGDHSFGKPVRITAQTGIGKNKILSVERETDLSGSIHDKGVLIISGFLRGYYGKYMPLSINTTVCFEQSYGPIDGDSASTAELCAVLSSISEIPLKQNIAITGSINQLGEIQPIGGANEKITGFFYAAQKKGVTKDLGVIIPHQNKNDLLLNDEIMEEIKAGNLKIYSVKHISEVIEILTDKNFGIINENGHAEPQSFNFYVMENLAKFNSLSQKK